MKTVIMMVGLPGSGKSTYIKQEMEKYKDHDIFVYSTDNILLEFAEQEETNYQDSFKKNYKKAIKEANKRLSDFLDNGGEVVIWDQTNISSNSRKKKLERFHGFNKHAIVVKTDIETCIERASKRETYTVPDFVIKQMHDQFEDPAKEEGFDSITVINT